MTGSDLGETEFGPAITGGYAQVMGDPRQLPSYSYAPTWGAGLVTLATAPNATGRVWHLPAAPARTTRQIVERV